MAMELSEAIVYFTLNAVTIPIVLVQWENIPIKITLVALCAICVVKSALNIRKHLDALDNRINAIEWRISK